MSKKSMSMCYPYGMGVSCICDGRGRIYKCFPNPMDMNAGAGGEDLDLDSEVSGGSREGMHNLLFRVKKLHILPMFRVPHRRKRTINFSSIINQK